MSRWSGPVLQEDCLFDVVWNISMVAWLRKKDGIHNESRTVMSTLKY